MPEQEQVQEPVQDTEATTGEEEYVPGEQDGGTEEPYSAQLLRQLHDDAGRLLERYDSMLPPLEHEAIKKFVEGYCQFLDSQMTEIEKHFGEHHPDLPPLEGMGPVGSENEEEGKATPEEAAEATEPAASETEPEKKPKKKSEEEEEEPEGGEKSLTPEQVKELRGKHKALPTPPVVGESALAGDEDAVETIDAAEDQAGVQFEPHEMDSLAEAHGFLSGVVHQQEPWGEIHRHEAYHHHRALGKIATLGDAAHEPGFEALEEEGGMEHEEKRAPSMGNARAMAILNSRAEGIRQRQSGRPSAPTERAHSTMGRGENLAPRNSGHAEQSSGRPATHAAPGESGPRGGSHNVQSSGSEASAPAGVGERRYKPKVQPRKDPAGNKMPKGTTGYGLGLPIPKKPTEAGMRGSPSRKKDLDEGEGDDKGTMEVLEAPESRFKSAHHEKVGKTSAFLQLLSALQDGGLNDDHRQVAHEHANGLEEAIGGGEQAQDGEQVVDEAQVGDEPPVRAGKGDDDMDADTKSLMDETNEQRATVLEFNKKIVELAKKLG